MYCVLPALAMALSSVPCAAAEVKAEQYPQRPIRLIVPFPPGGSDLIARAVAQRMGERFGQPLVVDNRPGAAGTLGTRLASTAAPDGYTLLFATSSFAISAGLSKTLPYDPVRDFAPVGLVAAGPFALVVNASLPVSSV
jgi:tripartite-type tricarboxylate transporter receptor subunit TctC